MSRHPLNRWTRIWLLPVFALICSPALGQSILPTYKSALDAEPYRQPIAAAINNRIGKLSGTDPKSARLWFTEQVAASQNDSPSFLDVYSDELDSAVLKAFAAKPPIDVRLNLAIITASIAPHDSNARLVPATYQILSDSNPALVLWGAKSAKFEVLANLSQPLPLRKADLVKALIHAVKTFPHTGAIAEEAFEALTFAEADPSLHVASNSVIQETENAVLELCKFRISLFETGAPEELAADGKAIVYLTRSKVWDNNARQQGEILRTFLDYLNAAAKSLQNPAPDSGTATLDFVHQIGRALLTISEVSADKGLKKSAEDVLGISATTNADETQQRLEKLKALIDNLFPH